MDTITIKAENMENSYSHVLIINISNKAEKQGK